MFPCVCNGHSKTAIILPPKVPRYDGLNFKNFQCYPVLKIPLFSSARKH